MTRTDETEATSVATGREMSLYGGDAVLLTTHSDTRVLQ
jgi:hypothetical protein